MRKLVALFMLFSLVTKAQRTLPNQCQWLVDAFCVPLDSAQISTLNSVPINVGIPTPASNNAIEVISASMYFTPTTAYSQACCINLISGSATIPQLQCNILQNSGISFSKFYQLFNTGGDEIRYGQNLYIQSNSDDLTGGGTGIVYIFYRLIK